MTDLEWKREQENNKQSIFFVVLTLVSYLLIFLLTKLILIEIDETFVAIMFFAESLIIIAIFYKINKNKRNHFIRNFITTILYIYATLLAVIYYDAIFCLLIPLVFSIRYNDRKYSKLNVAIFYVLYLFSFFINPFVAEEYSMEYVVLNKGITLYPGDLSVAEQVTKEYFSPLKYLYLRASYLLPYNIVYLTLLVFLGYFIINNERKYVMEEKKLLEQTTREESELEAGKKIQQNMLPNVFPAFPERKDFDIYAKMEMARAVGGDLYDFYFIDDDNLMIVVADVSDKGIPAALFMAKTAMCLRDNAVIGLKPSEILSKVNNTLNIQNEENMFATVFLGNINLKTGIMKYASAGHLPPLFYKKGKEYEFLPIIKNKMIGLYRDVKYEDCELKFDIGDKIFLYTDGVTDARNNNEEMYGEEKIKETLNNLKDIEVTKQLDNIMDILKNHIGERNQYDDIAMLAFEYKGI